MYVNIKYAKLFTTIFFLKFSQNITSLGVEFSKSSVQLCLLMTTDPNTCWTQALHCQPLSQSLEHPLNFAHSFIFQQRDSQGKS